MPPRAPNYEPVARHDTPGARRYARRPTGVERWKWPLTLLAAVAGGGWLVAGFVLPGGEPRYTHGPLAGVHAAWESNCQACHAPAGDTKLADIFNVSERWSKLTCEACHAGPAHHATAADAGGCATCHHDHQGRANSLVRIGDAHCTRCHADLKSHHRDGTTDYANAVTDFAGHPEFRKLRDGGAVDRSLKFSHALHMAPGVALSPDDRAAVKREGQLVQLTCASCHAADDDRRTDGSYFRPVSYEAHCQACHPLRAAEWTTAGGVRLTPVPLPHGSRAAGTVDLLRGEYARQLLAANPLLADRPAVPFERLAPEQAVVAATLRGEVEAAIGAVSAAPGGGTCNKCHELHTSITADGRSVTFVRPPDGPTVWLPHATFNHASHRGVKCQQCHPTAYAASSEPIVEREPANVLGVQSCRECHGPPRTDGGMAAGGVRHGCTDCHRYHDGDHPPRGRGAAARDPAVRLTIDEFLRGGTRR